MDEYLVPTQFGEDEFVEKKSRFIGRVWPVETEAEALEKIQQMKKQHYDATHNCWAYIIKDGPVRFSDDGEPSGTAGRPILGQIDSAGLSDVAVIVVRYFGGVKLGVPGLIAAYKEASRSALEAAVKVKKTAGNIYRLSFGYDSMPEMMKLLKDFSLEYKDMLFEQECSLKVRIRLSLEKEFFERTNKITNFKYYIL